MELLVEHRGIHKSLQILMITVEVITEQRLLLSHIGRVSEDYARG